MSTAYTTPASAAALGFATAANVSIISTMYPAKNSRPDVGENHRSALCHPNDAAITVKTSSTIVFATTPAYVMLFVEAGTFATFAASNVRSFNICVDTYPPVGLLARRIRRGQPRTIMPAGITVRTRGTPGRYARCT